ncbi:PA0069 family radical SAM protein [Caulobacter mirabilis]|uniref:Radical SAM protein n=1 Tax=Caulobacter mirabilis TaxID=69666 RepID=A0A2D2AZS5_9CAUL|nr:PA0069 family radical SAM protein [Caulobacter mirabilis]ATQ43495.1 radical SAM protein [Caulobacter mirabilis]
MSSTPPLIKGRGARSNATGRFESRIREAFDDGWTLEDPEPAQLTTVVLPDKAKTIINRNNSPDIGFDRSINPYRGCEHGCIYCFARPNHAYLGLSPGLDFESRLFFKPEAAKLLTAELSKPGYRPRYIQVGADTDPYQPLERRLRVTRQVLEVLQAFRHPFSVITKSNLISRDADILGEMGRAGLARAAISITTLDRRIARSMEPRAATPQRRLDAVRALSEAGCPVTVMFAPVVPGLTDHELEAVLEAAAAHGATSAGYVMLRLPLEIADLFQEWLATDHPDRADRVMSLVRQMRRGKAYTSDWGVRGRGEGPLAELVSARFRAARKRYGLDGPRMEADLTQFRIPPKAGDQMSLF